MAGVIASSTTSFNEVSQRINRVETALKNDLDRTDIANLIRRVQEFEKQKFEAVFSYGGNAESRLSKHRCGKSKKVNVTLLMIFVRLGDCSPLLLTMLIIRREEAIDNINEVMDEIRAEVY